MITVLICTLHDMCKKTTYIVNNPSMLNIVYNLCCNKISSKKFKNFNEFSLNCQTENLITKIVKIKIFYWYFLQN